MRIEKRNFSSISELEERAFCEGYMYAQKEFANQLSNDALAERLNRVEYDREMEKRKDNRTGGHIMGALGTAGMLTSNRIKPVINQAEKASLKRLDSRLVETVFKANCPIQQERAINKLEKIRERGIKNIKEQAKRYRWANRGLGLGAAALTAGGIYRINKKANSNMTYEDWLNSQNKD